VVEHLSSRGEAPSSIPSIVKEGRKSKREDGLLTGTDDLSKDRFFRVFFEMNGFLERQF
jgi:hypothetical protein